MVHVVLYVLFFVFIVNPLPSPPLLSLLFGFLDSIFIFFHPIHGVYVLLFLESFSSRPFIFSFDAKKKMGGRLLIVVPFLFGVFWFSFSSFFPPRLICSGPVEIRSHLYWFFFRIYHLLSA